MSKLLQLLRESTSTGSIACTVYGTHQSRRNQRRARVAQLAKHNDDELTEMAEFILSNGDRRPDLLEQASSVAESWDSHGKEKIRKLCEGLGKAWESTGLSGPVPDGSFSDVHQKLCSALERKYHVKVQNWEPVAEAVYVYINLEDCSRLRVDLSGLRNWASDRDYALVKKGTVDDVDSGHAGCDWTLWTFIYTGNQGSDDYSEITDPEIELE